MNKFILLLIITAIGIHADEYLKEYYDTGELKASIKTKYGMPSGVGYIYTKDGRKIQSIYYSNDGVRQKSKEVEYCYAGKTPIIVKTITARFVKNYYSYENSTPLNGDFTLMCPNLTLFGEVRFAKIETHFVDGFVDGRLVKSYLEKNNKDYYTESIQYYDKGRAVGLWKMYYPHTPFNKKISGPNYVASEIVFKGNKAIEYSYLDGKKGLDKIKTFDKNLLIIDYYMNNAIWITRVFSLKKLQQVKEIRYNDDGSKRVILYWKNNILTGAKINSNNRMVNVGKNNIYKVCVDTFSGNSSHCNIE